MVVIDVSFVIKLLKEEIPIDIFTTDEQFIAPELFDYEFTNVLWKLSKFNNLTIAEIRELLISMKELGIEKQKTDTLKLFLYSIETGLTAYDASYLLLAKQHLCPIATCDKQIIEVAIKEGIQVVKA